MGMLADAIDKENQRQRELVAEEERRVVHLRERVADVHGRLAEDAAVLDGFGLVMGENADRLDLFETGDRSRPMFTIDYDTGAAQYQLKRRENSVLGGDLASFVDALGSHLARHGTASGRKMLRD